MILQFTNTKITNNIMGIKYKNSIINQYHVIKVRLKGPNIMCTTPNAIPNAPKLKVVMIVLQAL